MDSTIFRIDDIFGVYGEQFNEEDAWKIGCATARFLPSLLRGYERGQANMQSICVGRDMRTHSESLVQALIEGMISTGTNVIDIGMIDTPQMYFAINHLGTCGGVLVTASHNPAKYNGFKLSGINAKPISADTGLKDVEHISMALLHTKGRPLGSVVKQDITTEYKNYVLKFLNPNVKDLKIAIDASNGMAGKMIPAIFGDLPIEIVELNFEHDGTFKHEPDPIVEKYLRQLKSTVKKEKCNFGVCFDGDADRLIMVDEKGKVIGCDLMTALMASYFLAREPRSVVVYDSRSSRVVMEEIIKHGGTPRRERVGQAYIKKALRDSHALFGGDVSGHFYYRDSFYTDSGFITVAHILNIVSASDKSVSELVKPLRKYFSSKEKSFEVENKKAKLEELTKLYSDAQIDKLDGITISFKDWWCNCRPSNTEPLLRLNVEAKTKELLDEKLSEISDLLGKKV